MAAIKWWLAFAGYALCWLIGSAWWYALFPFRMAQIEFGSMADWGIKNMKRMVAYLPILALFVLFPALAHAGQETRYYDASGRYQGRATTNTANPSQQSIYDASGRYLGRAMTKPDGSVKVYDAGGRFQGSTLPGRQPKTK